MICHRVPAIEEALGYLKTTSAPINLTAPWPTSPDSKSICSFPDRFSESAFTPLNDEIWNFRVAALGEERAREQSPEDGKRSPVEQY